MAAVVERKHLYQVVVDVLRDYLTLNGHMEAEEASDAK